MSRPFQSFNQQFLQRARQQHIQYQKKGGGWYVLLQRRMRETQQLVELRRRERNNRPAFREPIRQYPTQLAPSPRTTETRSFAEKSERVLGGAFASVEGSGALSWGRLGRR